MNHVHVHVGQDLPIDFFGGSYTVMRSLAFAQRNIDDHVIYVVTNVKIFSSDKYSVSENNEFIYTRKLPFNKNTIYHFHFSFTMLKFIIRNPRVLFLKRIFHFHGPWFKESQYQGDSNWKVQFKKVLESVSFRLVDSIVCASKSFEVILLENYGRLSARTHVFPLGVSVPKAAPDGHQFTNFPFFTNDFPILGSVRRLVPRMGLESLVKAVALNGKVNLVIAGEGSSRKQLEELAIELNVQDRVVFLGRITEMEKVEFYKRIQLLVVPTIALEGFGLVVLEAMAVGTPVIASNIDGLQEAMGPFAHTNTFLSNDPAALSEKIVQILSQDEFLERSQYVDYAKTQSWQKLAYSLESIL